MNLILIPAVLSTKQAHDYVGGSRIWEELHAAHATLLRPVRTVPRGDSFWRRESIDNALRVAEQTGSLVQEPDTPRSPRVLTRQGRRFHPGHLPA